MIAILVLYISPLGILLIYLAVDLSFLPAPIIAFIRYLNMVSNFKMFLYCAWNIVVFFCFSEGIKNKN